MRFANPYWLLAGLLTGVVLIALWRRHDIKQRAALARFVAPHLHRKLTGSVSGLRRAIQRGMFLLAMLGLCAALAGPMLGYHWEQITRRGNEVVFAIDTSRSMLTPDVKPNRLTRAKLAIDDMARQLEGDGIGIVAFAGKSFLVCPLTLDYGAFQQSLDAIDVHTIPTGGTNIPSAIEAARDALHARPGSDKILILVTDGENLEGNALTVAQEAAKQEGLKIYTVGVGTSAGELVPLPSDQGGGFVKDDKGDPVKSQLDEAGLKAIAAATGGAYVHLDEQGADFEGFLRTVFGAVTKHDLIYRQQRVYNQRYQWPLACSLAMLLLSMMVGTRRAVRRRATAVSAVAASAVIAVLILPARSESAAQTTTPTQPTTDAGSPVVQYNRGISAYRAGQFPQAMQAFQSSIKTAPSSDAKRLRDQQDAYYNLGNALYRAGQQFEKSSPKEAIQKWNDAVKAYDTALQLRADDADSKYNRDFVQRKIASLQQPPDDGGGGGGGGGGQGRSNGGGGSGQNQQPPQSQGQSQAQPPPQGQNQSHGQPPPQRQSQGQPPPQGQGQGGGAPVQQGGSAENEARQPGQMSADEARELLDSAKSEEHNSALVPAGPRDPKQDQPVKDW